jgi:hypothetical protein
LDSLDCRSRGLNLSIKFESYRDVSLEAIPTTSVGVVIIGFVPSTRLMGDESHRTLSRIREKVESLRTKIF